ncbi:MAG: bacteriocin, partial [Lachnospiraceae bacterium]|nr:bacteriocin [Lachnospiraceae bacterium]
MSMRSAVGKAMAVLAGTALCMAPAMNAYAKDDNVSITVTGPEGWVSERGEVKVAVEIKPDSGVEIKSIEARQGNGKWSDITESLTYMATDNGKVQIRVKDVEGKSYEEELELTCFDKEQPTLIAAVNEGVLHIQAQDGVSGIRNVYVNGYTFENVPDGDLTIRLQQFDATYAEFVIQVTDQAGNISDVYTVANPYATEDDELVHFLPTTAIPSDAETAVGTVT